jgi:hypothetical protein
VRISPCHCIIALSDDRWSECPARGWVIRSMHFRISGSNELTATAIAISLAATATAGNEPEPFEPGEMITV